jgi:predicted porin
MEKNMQGKMLVAALIAALPVVASAQSSVTLYGVVDAAVAREDTGAANGYRTVLNSGNQSTSRFGFRGTEDLGNGLKGVFNLEGGYNVDTGAGDAALFGRRAVVGLEGSFGQVLLGREYTPVADVANATDINGQGFYGTNLSSFAPNRLTRRISNSVNYRSNSFNGFKFGAAAGLGETADPLPSRNLLGVSAVYAGGPAYIGVAYHETENNLLGDDKELIVGGAFKFGDFEIKTNYMKADPFGANNKYEQINFGAAYGFGANKVFANVQRNELENGAEADGFSIAYSYALSKRTNVYATYAVLRNNATGLFALYSAGSNITPTVAGSDPKALALGVRHSF